MSDNDARYQSLAELHERCKQVIRLHKRKFGVMQIVELSGLSWPAVRTAIDLYEAGGLAARFFDIADSWNKLHSHAGRHGHEPPLGNNAQGRRAANQKSNLITGPVQICWHKFTRYWDIEHREMHMKPERLLMTPEEVVKRCDENTIGVVPTLGVTFTGQYEPVQAVSPALDQYQKETGFDIPIHVDAASGGFLAPF